MAVTLVTGGGSGIGAALCRRLAGPGARLLVHTGRRREKAEALAAELRAKGAEALVAVADFAEPARAAEVVERAVAAWGGAGPGRASRRLRGPAADRRP